MQTNTTAPKIYIPVICEYASQAILPIMTGLQGLTYTDQATTNERYYFSSIYGVCEKDPSEENKGKPLAWICNEYKPIVPDDSEYNFCFFYVHNRYITNNGGYYQYDMSMAGWCNESAFSKADRGLVVNRLTDLIFKQIFLKNVMVNNPSGYYIEPDRGIMISTDINDETWNDFDSHTFLPNFEKYISYRIRFMVGLQVGCAPYNQNLENKPCFTC